MSEEKENFEKVLVQIRNLVNNPVFELMFPLQYLEIKIREVVEDRET